MLVDTPILLWAHGRHAGERHKRACRDLVEAHGAWVIHRPGASDLVAAVVLECSDGLTFRAALVVVSAQCWRAHTLLTDRIPNGLRFGGVTIDHLITH